MVVKTVDLGMANSNDMRLQRHALRIENVFQELQMLYYT